MIARRALTGAVVLVALLPLAIYFLSHRGPEVVIYTSIDEMPARKVLDGFERSTGIKVLPVFDTEASKTTGLSMRLLSEMPRPRADVFWNNELANTVNLARRGAFQPYASPSAADVPSAWKDSGGLWTSMGLRARVIVYNTKLVAGAAAPRSLEALCDPAWKGKVGISDPRFGTCGPHAAALWSAWGGDKTLDFFRRLEANGVRVYAGNSLVRDAAASGEILVGLTDTDDVLLGMSRAMAIALVLPDQDSGGCGTLVFPNSVSLVAGAPHPDQGRRLVDYLLSREVERSFSSPKDGWIPVRDDPPVGSGALSLSAVKPMTVDWDAVSQSVAPVSAEISKILVQ
jgi:iron(III) transport system substrate-binding protein